MSTRKILLAYAGIMAAWTLAWMLKARLDPRIAWLASDAGGFAYWTAAKTLLWLAPAWWLIPRTGRSIVGVVNPAQWRRWLTWGGAIGLLIALSGLIPHALQGKVSIFALGLLFGYAAERGRSACGGMVAHFLNNLAA